MAIPSSTKWRLYFPWGTAAVKYVDSSYNTSYPTFPEECGTTDTPNDTKLAYGLVIGEWVMAAYVGGPNLCGSGVGTSFRDGTYIGGFSTIPAKAFDNAFPTDTDPPASPGVLSYWGPNYALHTYDQPNWLQYEFDAPVSIAEYGISNCNLSFRDPDPDNGEIDIGWVWELQYYSEDEATWITVDRRDFEKMRDFVNYFTVPGVVSPTRVNQIAVEVLRSNSDNIYTRTNQVAVEVLRYNGAEAGGGVIDPTPGDNPAFSNWFGMF